jgi:hypothetical protein
LNQKAGIIPYKESIIMTGKKGMKGSGGSRKGAGRKKAEELGVEKKKQYSASLRPSDAKRLIDKFGSITKALESLLKKLKP